MLFFLISCHEAGGREGEREGGRERKEKKKNVDANSQVANQSPLNLDSVSPSQPVIPVASKPCSKPLVLPSHAHTAYLA